MSHEPMTTTNVAPRSDHDKSTQLSEYLAAGARPSWTHLFFILPLLGVLWFLSIGLPPFLSLDPADVQVPLLKSAPMLHYAFLLAHVITGTVALVTICLQVWPWLRARHPAIHRASGRIYIFGGAVPSAVFALIVNPMREGWHGDLGSAIQASGMLLTALFGYRAIRRRQYAEHRRWMLYSFAMATSIIWGPIAGITWALFMPGLDFSYVMEFNRWASWMINLALVQWWLVRTANRTGALAVGV